jgi:hypothetical protein
LAAWNAVMKSLGTRLLLVLFVALVVQCAFDGPGAEAASPSLPQEDSAFCAILNAASVETTLPTQIVPQLSSAEAVGPLPEIRPACSLAQSIDHPPERLA